MDTRDTQLSILIQEYGVDAHAYYTSFEECGLKTCWRTNDERDFYRENMLTSLKDVLEYVHEKYQRRIK